jgi:hypothetical protein
MHVWSRQAPRRPAVPLPATGTADSRMVGDAAACFPRVAPWCGEHSAIATGSPSTHSRNHPYRIQGTHRRSCEPDAGAERSQGKPESAHLSYLRIGKFPRPGPGPRSRPAEWTSAGRGLACDVSEPSSDIPEAGHSPVALSRDLTLPAPNIMFPPNQQNQEA